MSLFCGCLDASKCKPQSHLEEPAISFNIKARLGTCPRSRLAALCTSVCNVEFFAFHEAQERN